MKPSLQLLAVGSGQVTPLTLPSLTALGGANSTGVVLESLRSKDDYAVISPASDHIQIHPLKGKQRGPVQLSPFQSCQIEDLTLIALDSASASEPTDDHPFLATLLQLIGGFSSPQDFDKGLDLALEALLHQLEMEKGLLIIRDAAQDFQIVAQRGVNANDPWLSETIVQDALSQKRETIIQNIIGSPYQNNKSLMATGFLSVFVWPLLFRGECLGVMIAGSQRPHSGLTEKARLKADVFIQIAALMLNFHLRDLRLKQELAALRKRQESEEAPLLTQNPDLIETCRTAARIAKTELGVLIQGETGVGKELMAKWIHEQSDRRQKAFVAVNCGAIPADLLESLLFGHRKGAFTGAHVDHVGKFQQADGGTLFLDEVADLPEYLQVKLLRALQEKIIEPLGSQRPIRIDVRLISASHKSLTTLMSTSSFRDDLYYRLAEITLQIPSLRDRPEDILLLASVFRNKYAPDKTFADDARSWLIEQPWKGNVRELMSAIRRAAVLSSGTEIGAQDFMRGMAGVAQTQGGWLGGANLEEAKSLFIKTKVREALLRAGGKRTRAAELLGVTPRTLFRYLEDLRWDVTDSSPSSDKTVMS